ncbi:hypothetical protein [Arthrobacter sp. HMWF013]|uniref:hypothetical protein n=1 Tax=Arthrobacter sp. HMWF013 TaxID=2056849 RepID=UPI000D363596|nr:hypothetical protein [Arthrobacter sp. HMWF013]PTT69224.1 hypothetical protein DBR22_04440 [Arthrobacter sp. HMWF013]
MMIRDLQGNESSVEESKELVRSGKVEVGYDIVPYDDGVVTIKSRLQPLAHDETDPLFLTHVRGDKVTGWLEYGTNSEEECKRHHDALVDRYRLLERERTAGIPKILLNGVL